MLCGLVLFSVYCFVLGYFVRFVLWIVVLWGGLLMGVVCVC